MKPFLIVVDDFLDQKEIFNLKNLKFNYETDKLNLFHHIEVFHPFINFISCFYNLKNCLGYEIWKQQNTRPKGWHFDKDEKIFQETKEIRFPICTLIYYLKCQNVKGGRLFFKDSGENSISPKQNRIILFSSGIEHYVEPFDGERTSIIINPWNTSLGIL